MKSLFIVAIFLVLILAVPALVLAQNNFRAGEVSKLERNEVINRDYFSSGEKVVVSGVVNGDVYAGGSTILIDGTINGDVLAAGGNINITGNVSGNVRAVGGNINIAGQVGRSLTLAGGNINLENGAKVDGSMVTVGGNIQIFGPVAKDLTIGAGSATIGNSVGNVTAGVGQIDLTANAKVNGDLIYYSEEKAGIAQEATISGTITQNLPPKIDKPDKEVAEGALNIGWTVYSFLTSLAFGLILIWLAPNYLQRISVNMTKRVYLSLGIGLLVLVLVPVTLVVLLITVIGIPFAIPLLVAYLFLLFFAKVFVAMAVGDKIFELLNQKQGIGLNLVTGLVALSIIGLIPIIGGIVSFIATLIGLGALAITKKELLQELRTKKIL